MTEQELTVYEELSKKGRSIVNKLKELKDLVDRIEKTDSGSQARLQKLVHSYESVAVNSRLYYCDNEDIGNVVIKGLKYSIELLEEELKEL